MFIPVTPCLSNSINGPSVSFIHCLSINLESIRRRFQTRQVVMERTCEGISSMTRSSVSLTPLVSSVQGQEHFECPSGTALLASVPFIDGTVDAIPNVSSQRSKTVHLVTRYPEQ